MGVNSSDPTVLELPCGCREECSLVRWLEEDEERKRKHKRKKSQCGNHVGVSTLKLTLPTARFTQRPPARQALSSSSIKIFAALDGGVKTLFAGSLQLARLLSGQGCMILG